MSTVWTIGYEGRTPDEFLGELKAAGIEVLVDVRELPMSRKKGFSKSALAGLVTSQGIQYVGERRLGAPREARHRLREGGDWAPFAQAYLAHLDSSGAEKAFEAVDTLARSKRVALLCFEKDALACHRGLLAARLARDGFDVVHL